MYTTVYGFWIFTTFPSHHPVLEVKVSPLNVVDMYTLPTGHVLCFILSFVFFKSTHSLLVYSIFPEKILTIIAKVCYYLFGEKQTFFKD